jgi:hypothetical protein
MTFVVGVVAIQKIKKPIPLILQKNSLKRQNKVLKKPYMMPKNHVKTKKTKRVSTKLTLR